MSRRASRAVLGGTFDRLHAGHEALLAAAFRHGEEVAIGLTTSRYLVRHPKQRGRSIRSFGLRRRSLTRYLALHYPGRRYRIVPLHDRFGGSLDPSVRLLVASAESRAGATAVNAERRRRGLSPVRIVLVPLVRGGDLLPISSTRVRLGLIDGRGRRRTPLHVTIVLPKSLDVVEIAQPFRSVLPGAPRVEVLWLRPPPGSSRGSGQARAEAWARRAANRGEYGVSLVPRPGRTTAAWMALADPSGLVGRAVLLRATAPQFLGRALRRLLRPRGAVVAP